MYILNIVRALCAVDTYGVDVTRKSEKKSSSQRSNAPKTTREKSLHSPVSHGVEVKIDVSIYGLSRDVEKLLKTSPSRHVTLIYHIFSCLLRFARLSSMSADPRMMFPALFKPDDDSMGFCPKNTRNVMTGRGWLMNFDV